MPTRSWSSRGDRIKRGQVIAKATAPDRSTSRRFTSSRASCQAGRSDAVHGTHVVIGNRDRQFGKRRLIADCRLPIADCRLPIADCRLPQASSCFLEPPRHILNVLPRHAARTPAARHTPFERAPRKFLVADANAEMLGITSAPSSRYWSWLQLWKPSHSPKRSDSDTFSSMASAGIDGRRALVIDRVARHQVPPVGRRVENDVRRAPFDAAFEHGLERLVARVVVIERKVVAEHDEPMPRRLEQRQAGGQRVDVLAVDLDQLEAGSLPSFSASPRAAVRPPRARL